MLDKLHSCSFQRNAVAKQAAEQIVSAPSFLTPWTMIHMSLSLQGHRSGVSLRCKGTATFQWRRELWRGLLRETSSYIIPACTTHVALPLCISQFYVLIYVVLLNCMIAEHTSFFATFLAIYVDEIFHSKFQEELFPVTFTYRFRVLH